MSLPIAPTPVLKGKHAEKFMAMVEEGLERPVVLIPTPRLEEARRKVLEEVETKCLLKRVRNMLN